METRKLSLIPKYIEKLFRIFDSYGEIWFQTDEKNMVYWVLLGLLARDSLFPCHFIFPIKFYAKMASGFYVLL